ncbi:sodium:solute symporter [Arthrobacter sp. MYb23]|uniref:sodium:solute symporter n=1 Tax=unclassified Arthrobacter TaxID=235627 RepID=UPI000CFB0B43|nr:MULTISPECIES: sodium:solute symporter [unclassified Arthrobacter]PRB43092.1 sodium:solute symporter [Arthrobacter sp. MYb51]PRB98044.1 sodium:solute symporter [Arthrobacter sp. MYb23]
MDLAIIVIYIACMLGIGIWAKKKAQSRSDFLVAGRRLGPFLYSGTMAAVVLGGGSTIGGVGLGYEFGISGMWYVFFTGLGILVLSLVFSGKINRLGIYTVSQMLELRYGPGSTLISGLVMAVYTLMLAVTSTIAYGTIFTVLFDINEITAIIIGGAVVVAYSFLGGMWSITLTDFVQFIIKTIGIFAVLLPAVLIKAGGWIGLEKALPESAFSLNAIGTDTVITYFVIYFFGIIIGQDIWQRVFTARTDKVARWAGTSAGVYCILYGIAGAVIGMGAKALLPDLANRNMAYPAIAEMVLPVGLAGLVLAAALAAIMSTSSGALIAAATVTKEDIVEPIRRKSRAGLAPATEHDEVKRSRFYILGYGILTILIACGVKDVLAALTIAYDILVGGLLVAIIGGLLWKRGTNAGALTSMATGAGATLITMVAMGDIYANAPIYVGLSISLLTYVVVSLSTKPTDPAVVTAWNDRLRGKGKTSDATETAVPPREVDLSH